MGYVKALLEEDMNRVGECNRCGSCCTSDEGFPVPKNWPDAVRNWRALDVESQMPHLSVLGLGERPDGGLDIVSRTFGFNLTGHKVQGVWVYRQGLCKNIDPLDDENTYEKVCPFLEDEKFGKRECSLMGTQYESFQTKLCGDMAPLEFVKWIDDEKQDDWLAVEAWNTAHPLCGYDWE